METMKQQIKNNMNMNGGGLAINITGRYESNRHAIAKMEQYTFGEVVAFLKKKKNGGFEISSKEFLNAYFKAIGEPEWHHAGFLPKQYGGGMKKTYFLKEIPTILEVKKILKKASKKSVAKIKNTFAEQILQKKRNEFLQKNAKQFVRVQASSMFSDNLPKFNIVKTREMNGKFGWFDSEGKSYNMPEYFSGWYFETEEKMNEYLNIK